MPVDLIPGDSLGFDTRTSSLVVTRECPACKGLYDIPWDGATGTSHDGCPREADGDGELTPSLG